MMRQNIKTILRGILVMLMLLPGVNLRAQETENEFQTRTKVDLSFKPFKKVKLTITPEFRFEEDFSLDKYLLEGEIEYKTTDLLSIGTSYGLVSNLRDNKDTEYSGRYAIFCALEKEVGRLEPSLRVMYSNYADDDIDDKNFLRYKAGLKYDIKDCKITPFVAVQLFQDISEGELFKTRYAIGANYKLFKKNYIGISYKFDYYMKEYLNRHIISVGYKIKF
ncbi:DUF2490 domain-containing protein [Puteibacter caeruleilacunae]|nr:DUF2490 domain-containing protein [Puteibacter caeruleilacunae]